MKNIKIGIALFSCLILGAIMFANSGLEAKNSDNKDNNEQAYIQDEIISEPEYVQDEILVKYKGDNKPFRVVRVAMGKVAEKVKEYKGKANVVYAEPNYILYAFEGPKDPLYANWQWALNNTGKDIYNTKASDCIADGKKPLNACCNAPGAICILNNKEGADINWEPAWTEFYDSDWATSNATTIIAILDTGIDGNHPDLANKLVLGKNFTTYGKTTNTNDVYGHGTHVAGIAGAETNNSVGITGGIAGVAFPDNIKIMPVKVLGDEGWSTTGSVANGIRHAANNGACVINLSLGGTGDYASETLTDAVNYAHDTMGVLIVAAAGNDGNSTLRYPASYPNVMSVAATDNKDDRASFSNYNNQIDISAPGVKVLSTIIYTEGVREYGLGSGTSMATPHIAGLAGLLFAQDNTRTNAQVRAIIEKSADDLGDIGWDKYFGHGKINVHAALTCAPPVDDDYDGYYLHVDCDDNNPAVNPGANEVCYDGIDNNCDSLIDSEDPNCALINCGNETLDYGEECDGENLGGTTCQALGYDGGNLTCTADCVYNETECTSASQDCSACFKGKCNGVCTKKDGTDCPDCQPQQ